MENEEGKEGSGGFVWLGLDCGQTWTGDWGGLEMEKGKGWAA